MDLCDVVKDCNRTLFPRSERTPLSAARQWRCEAGAPCPASCPTRHASASSDKCCQPRAVTQRLSTWRSIVEVWSIQLHMRLPVIPVPLLADDPDVTLDVQLALDTVYDAFNYDLSLDYTRPAEIPLVGDAVAWAAEHLRQAGIVPRIE